MGRSTVTAVAASVFLATASLGLTPAEATAGGRIDTVAGSGRGYGGDGGQARLARFHNPRAVAVDREGTVYVADTFNHRVRRVDPSGVVRTLVGTGAAGYQGDGGSGTEAALHWPHAVALDPSETVLYIADTSNDRIRRVLAP